jgi:hypothetical protein
MMLVSTEGIVVVCHFQCIVTKGTEDYPVVDSPLVESGEEAIEGGEDKMGSLLIYRAHGPQQLIEISSESFTDIPRLSEGRF